MTNFPSTSHKLLFEFKCFKHIFTRIQIFYALQIFYSYQGARNGFQSGGAMEHGKVLLATMIVREEKFLNSRRSRMAKTVTF